jgi:phospholipid/cholesterol/gamma-HCH transport system ATP-binding protein
VVSADLDELILRLRDALQVTIVVVTHDLDSAFRIADRITVLDQGRILITGTVEAVRNSSNERVQNLLNRRSEEIDIDADEYLKRLTADPEAPRGTP